MAAPFPINVFVSAAQLFATQLNAMVTALNTLNPSGKGSIFGSSTAGTPAELLPSSGGVLVSDSSTTSGLNWLSLMSAGKNKIINGDFGIWQRGISFTTAGAYTADRFIYNVDGGTFTVSQRTFTPGSAPVSGYESQYYLEVAAATGGNAQYLIQRIEDVRVFASQTVTLSYWAKANTPVTATPLASQVFGSGGSSNVITTFPSVSIGTSWQRVTSTFAIPTINTKTVGTGSYLEVQFLRFSTAATIDIWGVQLEAGSVATAFQTATGTVQGELALCQRYYFRNANGASTGVFAGGGVAFSTTAGIVPVVMPVPMRITPTTLDTTGTAANYRLYNGSINSALNAVPTISAGDSTQNLVMLNVAVVAGLLAGSNFQLSANTSTGAYLGFGAEL